MSVTYLRREPRRRLRQAGTRSRPAAGTTISTSGFQPADRPGRPDPEALRGNQLSRSSRAPRSLVVQHRLAVTLCGQAVPDHDQKGKLLFLQ